MHIGLRVRWIWLIEKLHVGLLPLALLLAVSTNSRRLVTSAGAGGVTPCRWRRGLPHRRVRQVSTRLLLRSGPYPSRCRPPCGSRRGRLLERGPSAQRRSDYVIAACLFLSEALPIPLERPAGFLVDVLSRLA
jgi:hypothetical protein